MEKCSPFLTCPLKVHWSWSSELTMMLPVCLRTETSHQEPRQPCCSRQIVLPATIITICLLWIQFQHIFFYDVILSLSSLTGSEIKLSESDKNAVIAPKCPPISSNGFMLILNMTGDKIGSCVSLVMINLLEDESSCKFIG